jgi:deoxyribodipyrimidine photo-lyase
MFVAHGPMWDRSPARSRFLAESLRDLDASLSSRGTRLVIRHGTDLAAPAVDEARRRGCGALYLTRDVTPTARRRVEDLRAGLAGTECQVVEFDGNEVVAPGAVTPAGRDAYRVFTPYLRAWEIASRRAPAGVPDTIRGVPYVRPGRMPEPPARPADRLRGGETAGRARMRRFLEDGIERYDTDRDLLGHDATSHLSADLRFGCVSPAELDAEVAELPGAEGYRRQLAWRDFFRQLVAAQPRLVSEDLRPERAPVWRDDRDAFRAWCDGRTGEPIVDAAMHQLAAEGWLPNRARLIVASYLVRTLGIDWRWGAAYFDRQLIDGDPCSNTANWQWVAGTGANPRRGHALSPTRQASRFDRDGTYRAAHPAAG